MQKCPFPFTACRKKKIIDGKCSKCQGTDKSLTFRIRASIQETEKSHSITVFEEDAFLLFVRTEYTKDQDLIEYFIPKLPIAFSGKISRNNLYDVKL